MFETCTPAHNKVDLTNPATLGVLMNSRTYNQYVQMYRMLETGECLFCNLHKLKYPVVMRKGNWALKECDMPYTNCEHHLILVFDGGHITDWDLLSRDDNADFMELISDARKLYSIKGNAVVFRQGDANYHAGTISHIHAHILVVKLDKNGMPVGELRAYFAKSRDESLFFHKMIGLFEKVRTGEIDDITKGVVIFKGGNYLTTTGQWIALNKPQDADLLQLSTIEAVRVTESEAQYYEAMFNNETGILLIDGPHKLNDAK